MLRALLVRGAITAVGSQVVLLIVGLQVAFAHNVSFCLDDDSHETHWFCSFRGLRSAAQCFCSSLITVHGQKIS